MFALNNVGTHVVLQRDPLERRRAAAVDEPSPPGLPQSEIRSPPPPPVPPERGFRTRRPASPRAVRSNSPRPRTERVKGKGKAEKKRVLSEEEQIAIARAALYGGGMQIS